MALGAILGLALAVSAAQAGKITLGKPVATADGGLDVSVTVAPDTGQEVAALQFDLHYDSSQYGFADAISGGTAASAGKDAVVSETEPGMVRVVVAGVNQDTLGSGTVATLHFDRIDKTSTLPAFSESATLDEVVASGPAGEGIEGLDISATVSDAASAEATAEQSSGDTGSAASNTSAQRNAVKATAASGVIGFDPAGQPAQRNSGVTNPRSATGMRAWTGSGGTAAVPAARSASGGAAPGQAIDRSASPVPVKIAKVPSFNGRNADGSEAVGNGPIVRGTAIAGRSSWVSPASPATGISDPALATRTAGTVQSLPAVTAAKMAGGAVRTNGTSSSGMWVFIAGGFVALVLVFGALAAKRG